MTGNTPRFDIRRFLDDASRWQAWSARDETAAGAFIAGVVTTRVYCRPGCAGRPKRENVRFYADPASARAAGLRACKRCKPDLRYARSGVRSG